MLRAWDWLQYGDVRVREDADLAGDLHRASHDLLRREIGAPHEGARRRERVGAARADRENAIVGLDDVAGAGDDESVVAVHHGEQRLETAKDAIAAPVLRQLDGRPRKIAGMLLELLLELLEE